MLTASCNNADNFKINGYEKMKSEFSDWCDASKCVFCKIDNSKVILPCAIYFGISFKAWSVQNSPINFFNFFIEKKISCLIIN